MSDDITRIGSDMAADHDRTDWAHIRSLSDAAIDAAMADDPDSFGLPMPPVDAPRAVYQVYRDGGRSWRWRLRSADGRSIADGPSAFATRAEAADAVREARTAAATADVRAA